MTIRAAPPPLPPRQADSDRRFAEAVVTLLLVLQMALGADTAAWRTAEAYLAGGEVISVDAVAERAGYDNRHRLRRALLAEGFRGPADLMGSLRIVRWLWISETLGDALAAQVLRVGQDSAVAYRLIRMRTGMRWTECREKGSAWFVETHLRPGREVAEAVRLRA